MKVSCVYCGTGCYVPDQLALSVARELRCQQCRTEIALPIQPVPGVPTKVELFHGRYEKLGPPTQSGQGFVFPAYDRSLRTFVAIKELTSPEQLPRFEQEVALSQLLTHENILHIHDHGQSRDVRYLSMEYLEGASLESLLETGGVSFERALDFLIMACEGLEYVHLRGVVHRDLKPANMFVTSDGVLKLMDFGSATSAADLPGATDVRAPGTRGYTAPEQVLSPSTVTQHADLWSLGAVAYQMFTGRLPYPELDEREAAREGRLPELPSSLNARVPAELDSLLLRALEGRPEHRLGDAGELCERLMALRRKLQPQLAVAAPITSIRPSPSASLASPRRARALVGAAALGLLGAGAWLLGGGEHAEPQAVASHPAEASIASSVTPAPRAAAVAASAPSASVRDLPGTPPQAVVPAATLVAESADGPHAQLRAQQCAPGAQHVPASELQLAHPRPRAWTFGPGSLAALKLADFCIDPRPVSVAAYARCVDAGRCPAHDAECTPSSDLREPMKCVSWQAAQQYCRAHGAELPSIAQWEAYGQAASARTDSAEWAKDAFPPAVFGARCGESNPALCDGHLFRKAGRLPIVEPDGKGTLTFSWNRGAATSAAGYDYVSFRCVAAAPGL